VADFFERTSELADMVGHGELTGMVEVSQLYAFAQHEHLEYRHPRGGQALYLQEPLMANYSRYLEGIAARLLDEGPEPAMVDSMENLAEEGGVATKAPVLWSNLRASGHPSVTSDGETVYDREPRQHRLSEEELKAIYRQHNPVPSRFTAKQLRFLWARGI
jgi:hypothetical protein